MPYIKLYRRHNEECRNRRCTCGTIETNSKGHKIHQNDCEGIDKNYRRCDCSVWFETNEKGKQRQWCSKECSWAAAERKARDNWRSPTKADLKRDPRPSRKPSNHS